MFICLIIGECCRVPCLDDHGRRMAWPLPKTLILILPNTRWILHNRSLASFISPWVPQSPTELEGRVRGTSVAWKTATRPCRVGRVSPGSVFADGPSRFGQLLPLEFLCILGGSRFVGKTAPMPRTGKHHGLAVRADTPTLNVNHVCCMED